MTAPGKSRILAIHSGALGDVILLGHLLSRLAGSITLASGREKAHLLAGAGVVDKAIDFDALPMQEVFADTPGPQCRLPSLLGRCDRLISCFGSGEPKAQLRLAALCGAADATFLPIRPPEGFTGHLVELWCDLLGLQFDRTHVASWKIPQPWRRDASDAMARAGIDPERPYVVIHPGSGGVEKCWPLERFIELGGRLEQAFFVVGPAECDRWPAATMDSLRRQLPLLTCPALATLAGLLAGAQAFVGNDSGVAHLAAAVGTNTLALFGPTRSNHFAPLGRSVRVIAGAAMDRIAVGRVAQEVHELHPLRE